MKKLHKHQKYNHNQCPGYGYNYGYVNDYGQVYDNHTNHPGPYPNIHCGHNQHQQY